MTTLTPRELQRFIHILLSPGAHPNSAAVSAIFTDFCSPLATSTSYSAESGKLHNDDRNDNELGVLGILDQEFGLGLGYRGEDRNAGIAERNIGENATEYTWEDILCAYVAMTPSSSSSPTSPTPTHQHLPPAILSLIEHVHASLFRRDPMTFLHNRTSDIGERREEIPGMSPKKAHEVIRMRNAVGAIVRRIAMGNMAMFTSTITSTSCSGGDGSFAPSYFHASVTATSPPSSFPATATSASTTSSLTPPSSSRTSGPSPSESRLPLTNGVYIVDVGAGQGHLARALSELSFELRVDDGIEVKGVLALDGDPVLVSKGDQAPSAKAGKVNTNAKKQRQGADSPRVTHKYGRITSPEGLIEAVDGWWQEMEVEIGNCSASAKEPDAEVPVILVTLHGCGSLSVDVLRAFVQGRYGQRSSASSSKKRAWGFIAALTVPCCYNLLRDGEYPLCSGSVQSECPSPNNSTPTPNGSTLPSSESNSKPPPTQLRSLLPRPLPPIAYHLAAQVPATWVESAVNAQAQNLAARNSRVIPTSRARLALRKVVWRALLERILSDSESSEDGRIKRGAARKAFIPPMEASTHTFMKSMYANGKSSTRDGDDTRDGDERSDTTELRIGRLPARAYASWDAFLAVVQERMDVDLSDYASTPPSPSFDFLSAPSPSKSPTSIDSPAPEPLSQGLNVPPSLQRLARALSILHTLRAILGPLIESELLRDRVEWVKEALSGTRSDHEEYEYSVSIVPLFSQYLGSARNMGVLVLPLSALEGSIKGMNDIICFTEYILS